MGSQLAALGSNRVLWAAIAGWLAAQLVKMLRSLIDNRKLDLSYMVSSGGMPSAHSALVTAMATAVARIAGLGSPLFAVSAVFASVVMYDAAGVRLAVSMQARILNHMIDDFFHERGLQAKRLRELIGHSPREVLVGALVGIIIGLLFTR
ncbi:MAG: divergent PAP2 family protein [Ktedonobacterales bacterium]